MKKSILFILLTAFLGVTLYAQNDTLFIMKNGTISGKYIVNTQIDSVIFYDPIPTTGIFTDARDNIVYNWVRIGNQTWMAENLKYLPSVVGQETGSYTIPYYNVYGYNGTNVTDAKATSNYNTYGVLYNWPAAMNGASSSTTNPSGVQGVCPLGWHLPSTAEWIQLVTFIGGENVAIGGENVAGGKLKETGTTHWNSPNLGATNETGFTALPGGYHYFGTGFSSIGIVGYWWCTTEFDSLSALLSIMVYNDSLASQVYSIDKVVELSVRCVRD